MSTTISGNINDLTGTAVSSGCYVRFWLRGCNGNQPRVGGAALIAPDNGPNYFQDFVPVAGAISGTMYSNDVNVSAGGQVGVTWYGVQVFLNGIGGAETPYSLADGTTFNLNSATPISTAPVVAAPTGDSTYARLDGGNTPFSGAIQTAGITDSALISGNKIATTGNGVGNSTGSTAGGALNVVKASSPAATFMGRFVDQNGNTNAQLLGVNIEQMINPTGSVSYQNSAIASELVVPIGNTQNFTGTQVCADLATVFYGSGTTTAVIGVIGESWNSGPGASNTEVTGIAGGAHNGSVSAGSPVQTPTGNGSIANLRGVKGSASNSSSGTVTTAIALYADAITNSGGGTITTAVGVDVSNVTAGSTNFAIRTGTGPVSIGDATTINSSLRATGNVAIGATAVLSSIGVAMQPSTGLSGTGQTGLFVFPSTTSAATAQGTGIQVRADVAASTTQTLNVGLDIATPSIGSSGVITTWNGLRIEKAPTAGTAHSIVMAGSTSGLAALDPPATGGVNNILPSTAGTLTVVVASGTSTLTANATLGAVTSQAAVTTAATGAATTDSIEWAYTSAPGAGDSLCIVSPYVTSGNVNFVRANPTAASQNVSAIVVNWRIIR